MADASRRLTLETCPDAESRGLLLAAGDLKARFKLFDLAEAAYWRARDKESTSADEWRAVAMLFHAEMYLKDRLAYQLFPPPGPLAIRLPVDSEAVPARGAE